MRSVRRRWAGRWLAGGVVLAGACGSSGPGPGAAASADRAVTQIEEVLVDEIGVGPLAAECEPPTDGEPGTPFPCSATTDDGRELEFTAELVATGMVEVRSTNLVATSELETQAVAVLSAEADTDLDSEAMTCPATAILVVEVGSTVDCELVNPRSQAIDAAVITVTALDPIEFDVELG